MNEPADLNTSNPNSLLKLLLSSSPSTRKENPVIFSSSYSAQEMLLSERHGISHALLDCYLSLFGLRTGSAVRRFDSTVWRPMSQFHYLTDDELLASLSDKASTYRACPRDDRSKFAVIEVPEHSPCSSPHAMAGILDALHRACLRPCLYKAAGSNDIHLYIYFAGEVDSRLADRALSNLLTQSGYSSQASGFRLVPFDQPVALPLQKGFQWLTEDLRPKVSRDEICLASAIALFVADLHKNAVDPTNLIDQYGSDQSGEALPEPEVLPQQSGLPQSSPSNCESEIVPPMSQLAEDAFSETCKDMQGPVITQLQLGCSDGSGVLSQDLQSFWPGVKQLSLLTLDRDYLLNCNEPLRSRRRPRFKRDPPVQHRRDPPLDIRNYVYPDPQTSIQS